MNSSDNDSAKETAPPGSPAHRRWTACAVAAILSAHFILAFTSLRCNSIIFDEPAHIGGGITCLRNGDFSMTPDNGLLPQIIAAIPLLFTGTTVPEPESPLWNEKTPYQMQSKLLFGDFSRTDTIVFSARTAILAVSVLTGLAVFAISRSIFGTAGGFLSLILYCFSPSILAHARFATSDLVAASAFLISVWAFWRSLHRITVTTVAASSISFGLLCLSKMSFFIIIPVCLAMILLRITRAVPAVLEFRGRSRELATQSAQIGAFACSSAASIIAALVIVWAFHGFRFAMHPEKSSSDTVRAEQAWDSLLGRTGAVGKAAKFARDHRILPEAFTYGFLSVYDYSRCRYSFLDGEFSTTGWWSFFPLAFLYKTPIPMLFLLMIAIFAASANERKRRQEGPGTSPRKIHELYELSPYAALVAVYFVFAVASRINIGDRHILAIYPPLFIICGAASLLFREEAGTLARKFKVPVIALAMWLCLDSIAIWPDYLSYFNGIAGGPKNGYRHLVDSSLDWGQDLRRIKSGLEKSGIPSDKELYISYFGIDTPERFGLEARVLPGYLLFDRKNMFPLRGGTYVISATMLQMVYFAEMFYAETGLRSNSISEELYKETAVAAEKEIREYGADPLHEPSREYRIYNMLRFAKLCIFLNDRKPDAFVGYSMLVFRLSDQDIAAALEAK